MEWVVEAFGTAALTGAAVGLINVYFSSKLKHDLDTRLEAVKPVTTEETLRRQNYLNSKREAFFEAIGALNSYLEAVPWNGPDIPKDRPQLNTRPSEAQVNTTVAKLALFTDNPEITELYLSCFTGASAPLVGKLLSLMRSDLGYGNLKLEPSAYKFYFKNEPQST